MFWWFSFDMNPPVNIIGAPLWAVFLALAFPTALMWYHDRRRFPAHCCRKCGYDLTGNISGRCPECGEAVEGGAA